MAYTTINKSGDYFNTKLYTGNYSTNAITGVGHQPDMVWLKSRSFAQNHEMYDAVRTATKRIYPNGTYVEDTDTAGLTAFNSDGFTLGSSNSSNKSGDTFASWNWKAGTGQGSSNTDGSINTTYTSVNTTAGFSISSYTGTGSNATVGHGLGSIPKMIIVKNRDNTTGWGVYHASLGNTKYLQLNDTAAEGTASTFWNNTTPTNQVFSIGTSGWMNNSGEKYIAYCFADKKGYSKFGSYTGNGNADGTFIYTGFKPAFVIAKRSDAGAAWVMYDSKRDIDNPADHRLLANANNVELVGDANTDIDFLSNGFKTRNADSDSNASGGTYIYMAFAEEPLVANSGTDGVPATAR